MFSGGFALRAHPRTPTPCGGKASLGFTTSFFAVPV